jgi:hypothetical protein
MANNTPTQWIDIDDLTFWDGNPNEGDIGAIITSIKEFGYNNVVASWNNIIKGGNHSIKALLQLRQGKWKPTKASKQLKISDGKWLVSAMDISHMEEVAANAFGIALNTTTRRGYDDPATLLGRLEEIQAESDSMLIATGYSHEEMDELFDISSKHDLLNTNISTSRLLGSAAKQIKPVLYIDEIAVFETAMRMTGEANRGSALMMICQEYIDNNEEG